MIKDSRLLPALSGSDQSKIKDCYPLYLINLFRNDCRIRVVPGSLVALVITRFTVVTGSLVALVITRFRVITGSLAPI